MSYVSCRFRAPKLGPRALSCAVLNQPFFLLCLHVEALEGIIFAVGAKIAKSRKC